MTPNGGGQYPNGERVGRLEIRMDKVEEGVANFRDFQVDARDFFARSDERAKHRAKQEMEEKEERDAIDRKRSRIHFWWLGILSSIIIAGFSILLGWAINFEEKHKISQDHPAQSSVILPQDSSAHAH